jgi:hypothetical protein
MHLVFWNLRVVKRCNLLHYGCTHNMFQPTLFIFRYLWNCIASARKFNFWGTAWSQRPYSPRWVMCNSWVCSQNIQLTDGSIAVSSATAETPKDDQCWSKHVVYIHQWCTGDIGVLKNSKGFKKQFASTRLITEKKSISDVQLDANVLTPETLFRRSDFNTGLA